MAPCAKTPAGGLNLIVVNKDTSQNLQLTTFLPQMAGSATLTAMTSLDTDTAGPSLSSTSGVAIQGATVGLDGAFTPSLPQNLPANGSQLEYYVPALSAVLIQVV
jgi:hypothetical protein